MKNKEKIDHYKILMDWWVLVPLGFLLLCFVLMIPMLTLLGLTILAQIAASMVIVLTILYIVDTAFFTYYQFERDGLVIGSQLRHMFFAYRDMKEVKPVGLRSFFSWRGRKRFSLSLHAYQISLRKGYWKSITISPAERDLFINKLMEYVDRERSQRVTTHKK